MPNEVIYSVLGGLIVLVLIWLWNNVFPPIIQRFYRDEPKIGGSWKTTFWENQKEYHETVTIRQKGRKVRGTIVLHEDEQQVTTYKFEGRFKYLVLTGTYDCTDPTDIEQGAFALHYKQGKFSGKHILFSKESDKLISSDYHWERRR